MAVKLLLYRFVIFNTDGSEGEFVMSYEQSTDITEQQFHAVPPEPALPPKDAPQPALNYEHG